jgi:hypothetical protein
VKFVLSSSIAVADEQSISAAAMRVIEAQLEKLILNVPAETRKNGELREMVGDVVVISQLLSDRKPDPLKIIRGKGNISPDSEPCWKASDETVRFPVVTERNAVPPDRFADETTGNDPEDSDEYSITL